MAKKKKEKATEPEFKVANEIKEVIIKEPQEKKETRKEPTYKKLEDGWELKDRMYYLKNDATPLTYLIRGSNIFWFDSEKGYERELKYTSNQKTCFVDEMKGDQRLAHIIFENGSLFVPKEKTVLQKLLSLYHPHRDKLFEEYKPVKIAADEVDILELEIEALSVARDLDIDMAEAVMRVENGSKVSKMTSKELKRDLLLYAKRNPSLFLELVNDDNVVLRNFGIKATEMGILKLSSDQRTFMWGSNDRKLLNVPFDEHPYSALASWFKTDEGMEVYSNIEKRLN
tara:strand:+ start:369 stop:1223 length:855 start_codon:yes stop_codon:yes gene_type:complete